MTFHKRSIRSQRGADPPSARDCSDASPLGLRGTRAAARHPLRERVDSGKRL